MKDRGPNIPLVTNTGSGLFKKASSKLNPARVCADHPTPMEHATHTGEGLVQVNFDEVKWVFHHPLGFKNTILRGSRGDPVKGRGKNIPLVTNTRSGLCTRKLFSKLNPARVCEDHLTPTEQAPHTGEGLVRQILKNSRGFINL